MRWTVFTGAILCWWQMRDWGLMTKLWCGGEGVGSGCGLKDLSPLPHPLPRTVILSLALSLPSAPILGNAGADRGAPNSRPPHDLPLGLRGWSDPVQNSAREGCSAASTETASNAGYDLEVCRSALCPVPLSTFPLSLHRYLYAFLHIYIFRAFLSPTVLSATYFRRMTPSWPSPSSGSIQSALSCAPWSDLRTGGLCTNHTVTATGIIKTRLVSHRLFSLPIG